jgi:hypothetical protein
MDKAETPVILSIIHKLTHILRRASCVQAHNLTCEIIQRELIQSSVESIGSLLKSHNKCSHVYPFSHRHGKCKNYIHIFSWEDLKENHFGDLFTNESVGIKWILRKRNMNMRTEPGVK